MENKLDIDRLMTDQMKAVLKKQTELVGNAYDTNAPLDVQRANYIKERAFWNAEAPEMAKSYDTNLEGPLGPFRVRFYYPAEPDQAHPAPGIVYIHGGGFILGTCETHDRVCRLLASKTGAVVVSVDYHLSPESQFPNNIKEAVVTAKHLHEHAAELGVDADDISFAGDSGGAVLSMATNLWLRDVEGDNSYITTMILYYGYYGLTDSCSRRIYGTEVDGMRAEDLKYYNDCWLGDDPAMLENPYVDMLHNDLATSMPACYIASAGLDPLKDDSVCLSAILTENGVPNYYEDFPGVLHGYIHYTRMLDEANQCIDHSVDFWKKHHKR
jgi:acetyl esterase